MSNYTANNLPRQNFLINEEDYWDFVVNHDDLGCYEFSDQGIESNSNCLASYIDTDLSECISGKSLISSSAYTYSEACSHGLNLENFGLTSTDNGYTLFYRDEITNKDFYELYTNTSYVLSEDDLRLHLYAVSGNTGRYEYPMSFNDDGTIKLNGGFYQGFFCSDDDYMVLPSDLRGGDTWNLEFVLRPMNYDAESDNTLNDKYPNNKGIFFYIGTRAENKWVYLYSNKISGETSIEQDGVYDTLLCDDIKEGDEYFDDVEDEVPIDSMDFETSNGFDLDSANDAYLISDNKFILYDRTPHGLTTITAFGDEELMLMYKTKYSWKNLFLYLNRTPSGYTALNVDELTKEDEDSTYNSFYKDIYENALAFKINEDGSIGYRYLIKSCSADTDGHYAIIEGNSYSGMVKTSEWSKINVKIKASEEYMKLYFYVNNKLKYITSYLPKLNLHELDELDEKEEGVAYNLSLGGGTQGLAETILPHYMLNPTEVYPLESHFAGTFVGDFKSFKFYTC